MPALEKHDTISAPSNDSKFKVTLADSDDPQRMSTIRKWLIVIIISLGTLLVTCASSMSAFTEAGVSEDFHVGKEVAILAISLYVIGLGIGPLLAGPLSELYGRNIIYQVSFGAFFALSWPVAFAPDAAVFLIFRFLTGFCGSTFLSVAGGSVSDLFPKDKVANPLAVYTLSPFSGPVLGPLFSGFINQNLNWRWTYHIIIIWSFAQVVALLISQFVPETYAPAIVRRKVARLRSKTGDSRYWSEYDMTEHNLAQAILRSIYVPFQLLLTDRMVLILNTWTALLLGILYLAFQAFPFIFINLHHFNTQSVGLSFLGIGVGTFLGLATQPYWNYRYLRESEKNAGDPPPEVHLRIGQVGGILCPMSLFCLAFTSYRHVHWIAPIISSIPFGTGTFFIFTSVFTYLVTAYRPIAASAMASNSAMRSSFAAGFPLFAGPMYARLSAPGATALLAGLMALMIPLPFVFDRIGDRLRAKSRFAMA
ncbi:MFS general substrate transporter [Amanita rubescens]|nr:MFS general substrate transporter [Amanita rubescens]